MPFYFSKLLRLRKKNEFNRLKKGDTKLVFDQFVLVTKKSELSMPRLGIIVSKKVSKKACIRNQYKRVIRESFRLKANTLKPVDYLVIVRHNPTHDKYHLRQSLDKAWQRYS